MRQWLRDKSLTLIGPPKRLCHGAVEVVNGPLLLQALSQSALHGIGFLAAFYGTFLSMLAATVFLFDRVRSVNPRANRLILWATIAMLCFFAITLIVGLNL